MSVFQNVSGLDLELLVDGRRIPVAADGTVEVADEFDYQLVDQTATWKFSKKKSVSSDAPAVPVTEAAAVTEGDN